MRDELAPKPMMRSTPRSGAPGNAVPPHRLSTINGALVATLLFAVALVPLWSVDIPPLMDYHNHLARRYIFANLQQLEHLQTRRDGRAFSA
jgi:hypothetical protein